MPLRLDSMKAYIDLTRIQFFLVWPLLYCSGLFLSFSRYGGFSWPVVWRAALIALLGFEAGFVLNDYVDRELDEKDVEHDRLTKYWRLFGSRPIPSGDVSPHQALTLFISLIAATTAIVLTIPYPHSAYVLGIMVYSYALEYFYQVKKRDQKAPVAQLLGRTDFTLFPVAGYLSNGHLDAVALLYFLFFYPFAQAHLGANDIIDVANDEARGLKTVAILFGTGGTVRWIHLFTMLHSVGVALFASVLGLVARIGLALGLLLLLIANVMIRRGRSPEEWLRALPLFHVAMLAYTTSIITDYFI